MQNNENDTCKIIKNKKVGQSKTEPPEQRGIAAAGSSRRPGYFHLFVHAHAGTHIGIQEI